MGVENLLPLRGFLDQGPYLCPLAHESGADRVVDFRQPEKAPREHAGTEGSHVGPQGHPVPSPGLRRPKQRRITRQQLDPARVARRDVVRVEAE